MKTETRSLTFTVPHIVKSRDADSVNLRTGKSVQLDHKIEQWETDAKVEDVFPLFPEGFAHTSLLMFGGRPIRALDENSVPTAQEYLENVGKEVVWRFTSEKVKDKWHNFKVTIVLP